MNTIDTRKAMFDIVEFLEPYIVAENLVSDYEYHIGYIDRNGTSSIYIQKTKDGFEIKKLTINCYLLGVQVIMKHWFEPDYEKVIRDMNECMELLKDSIVPDLIKSEKVI